MSLKKFCLPLLGCTMLACAAPVGPAEREGTELAENPPANDQEVRSASAELPSGTLPDSITLVDQPGGLDERVLTAQGFMFSTVTASSSGIAAMVNPTAFGLFTDVTVAATCHPSSGSDYVVRTEQQLNLRPNDVTQTVAPCRNGDSAKQSSATFDRIYSDAGDTSFTPTDCGVTNASLTSDNSNNGSPNGTVFLCSGLSFRDKKRSTWGSSEFTNNGTSSVTVKLLFERVFCSGGGNFTKSWGPQAVAPGETMTSTIGCPSGQTVTRSAASFTR